MKFHPALIFVVTCLLTSRGDLCAAEIQTEQQYLSGHGPKDAVSWEFSVTGGRRAGEWTTIPVPSNWEQQGFGSYNYGQQSGKKADEHGLYRLHFAAPDSWKGKRVRLVFEGVMTDASVKVNGRDAGPIHQGGFYRFSYDVTTLLKLGADNLLEVDVAKVSANAATEIAERGGDYWVFGGIYRPVLLEVVPWQAIEHAAIDARADGSLKVDVDLGSVRDADRVEAQVLDADGKPVGATFSAPIPNGGTARISLATHLDAPRLWTAESPNLYSVRLTLRKGADELHTTTERFGFRTFEVRAGKGLFLNGQRILLKGVGRHSFRPETGRALSREDCYDDARLIKAMNMNAVRMTHYPPDVAFLEACDELGLYVIDELSGWHRAHDTEVGRRLVREMITRDVNHPSILLWDNGNEGGWNRDLDGDFALYDPQNRTVLHPWETFNGIDTKHYPVYDDLVKRLAGPNLVIPTEMIHALYDGGGGAGLEDYWKAIASSPFGGGGFIWVFADEGIMRTDQNGRIDVFSTLAPDGLVGPHHEKEGSYYTVRDLYSPVQIDPPVLDESFRGKLVVHNRYDFQSLAQCGFKWRLLSFAKPEEKKTEPTAIAEGSAKAPDLAPHADGEIALTLPENWREADALALVATGSDQQELWTWTWPTAGLGKRLLAPRQTVVKPPALEADATELRLRAGAVVASFDPASGVLKEVRNGDKVFALSNGPRLAFARPSAPNDVQWLPLKTEAGADAAIVNQLDAPQVANVIEVDLDFPRDLNWAGFQLEISPDGKNWRTIYDATRRPGDGKLYEFPPQTVAAVRLSHFRRTDGEPVTVKQLRIGYQAARFPAAETATITTGTDSAWIESNSAGPLNRFRWTMQSNGDLRLDYSYALEGEFSYHGITFDHPEEKLSTLRWLGEGPTRVWQNRLRGTSLGVYQIARSDPQPGETWTYPEFQGCFAGLRWARLDSASGPLTITSAEPETYLRVGTPRISHINTTVAFPAGDISFLRAIPPIGSKFVTPEKTGPASQWSKASGPYTGTLLFRFGDPQE